MRKNPANPKVRARWLSAIIITAALAVGILTCVICDEAVTGGLSWSLYPISACVLVWLVVVPALINGRGVLAIISFSLFIIPFILALDAIIGGETLLVTIGVRVSLAALLYIWAVYCASRKLRPLTVAAVSLLLVIPLQLGVNAILSALISEPLVDFWDIVSFITVGAAAVILLIIRHIRKHSMEEK